MKGFVNSLTKPFETQEIDGMNQAVASHEGCHVYGWLDVKRVAANFHISVHVEDYMMLAQVKLSGNCPIMTASIVSARVTGLSTY